MRISTVLILLLAMMSANAATPNFSSARGVLYLPNLTVDGQDTLNQMEMRVVVDIRDLSTGKFVNLETGQVIEVVRAPALVPTPVPIIYGEPFWLFVGQSGVVTGTNVGLKFNKVTEDSRCPPTVTCFWEGQVTVDLTLSKGKVKSLVKLTLATPNSYTVNGLKVTLLVVDPYPKYPPPPYVSASAYSAQLVIEQFPPPLIGTPVIIQQYATDLPVGATELMEETIDPSNE